MVTLPPFAPVTVTVHVPVALREQVAGLGKVTLPVPPDWDKLTVSPVTVPEYPEMVAVQLEVLP
jgi:hypothetical protein